MLTALKRGLLLFLMLKFFLPYKFVSTIPGWECPVPHVLLSNTYYSMGKSKEIPLRKTMCIEGMTQNRAQNPWLSALYKHPKISLLSTGLSLQRLSENPEQVRNLWSPHLTCWSWQWNFARRGRGHTSMALLLFARSYALIQWLAMSQFLALEEMLLSFFHSKNLFSVTLSPSGTVPINVWVKRKRIFSFPFYCHGTNSPLSYFTIVFTLVT